MRSLEDVRYDIDKVDEELVRKFVTRMDLVKEVLDYKKKNNLPILNANREEEVIKKALNMVNDDRYNKEIEEFFKAIMSISKNLQSRKWDE